jgi:hypothetical protein
MSRSPRPRIAVGVSIDEQARIEIKVFLQALESYAARFAMNPEISFDEHHAKLMRLAASRPKQPRRRRGNG